MKNNSKKTTSKVTKSAVAATTVLTLDAAILAVVDTILANPGDSTAIANSIRIACNAYDTASSTSSSANTSIDALVILDTVTDKVLDQLKSALKTDAGVNMAKAALNFALTGLRTSTETAVDDLYAIFAHRSGYAGTYVANATLLSAFTVEEVKSDTEDRLTEAKRTLSEKVTGLNNARNTIKDATKLAEIEATAKAEIKDLERQIKRLEGDLTRLTAFGDSKAIAKIGLMINQHGKKGAFLVNRDTDTAATTPTRLPRWATGEQKPIWVPLEPGCGVANGLKRGDSLASLIKIEIKEVGKKARFLCFTASK